MDDCARARTQRESGVERSEHADMRSRPGSLSVMGRATEQSRHALQIHWFITKFVHEIYCSEKTSQAVASWPASYASRQQTVIWH